MRDNDIESEVEGGENVADEGSLSLLAYFAQVRYCYWRVYFYCIHYLLILLPSLD